MAVLVLPVPGSKIVVKSRPVKRNAKNARGLGRNRAPPPTFPSRRSLIFALLVLIRPHYTTVSESLAQASFGWARKVTTAGEGRETARRLGREQRETACKDGGLFWVVCTPAHWSFRLDMNIRLSRSFARVLRSLLRLRRAGPPDKVAVLRNIKQRISHGSYGGRDWYKQMLRTTQQHQILQTAWQRYYRWHPRTGTGQSWTHASWQNPWRRH